VRTVIKSSLFSTYSDFIFINTVVNLRVVTVIRPRSVINVNETLRVETNYYKRKEHGSRSGSVDKWIDRQIQKNKQEDRRVKKEKALLY
jgi:hypothetical protein